MSVLSCKIFSIRRLPEEGDMKRRKMKRRTQKRESETRKLTGRKGPMTSSIRRSLLVVDLVRETVVQVMWTRMRLTESELVDSIHYL